MKSAFGTIMEKGRGRRAAGRLLPGLLLAAGVFLGALSGAALLIGQGSVTLPETGLPVRLLYGLACGAGCFLNARRAKTGKLLWAGLTALLFLAVTAAAAVLLRREEPMRLLALMPGAGVGLVLGVLLGAGRKRERFEIGDLC